MTIFDILRYPIDNPPDACILKSLPTDLYRQWIDDENNTWHLIDEDSRYDPTWVADWIRTSGKPNERGVLSDLALLRQLIKEYQAHEYL
jgi:hypothetical protein